MSKHDWDSVNELELDELLRDSMSDLPPEDVVTEEIGRAHV